MLNKRIYIYIKLRILKMLRTKDYEWKKSRYINNA